MAIKMKHEETKNAKRIEDRGSKIEDRFTRDPATRDPRPAILNPHVFFALFVLFASFFTSPSQNYLRKWNLFWFGSSATRDQSLSSVAADIREEELRANSSVAADIREE